MTCLGSATVLFFRKKMSGSFQQLSIGFAAGVMIAASVWGLLIPAIEETEARGGIGWIPAAIGLVIGVLFMLGLDKLIPHLHPQSGTREGPAVNTKRSTLLFFAVTLHNIPEGMAAGLVFALAMQVQDAALYMSALALAIGIGIQNFPEGAAVSLVLRQDGLSAKKAFTLGCLSGVVEPIFGFMAVLLAAVILPIMPWLLAFTAGAMIYVVVEELIPEACVEGHSHLGTMSFVAGFVMMMVLDVTLG